VKANHFAVVPDTRDMTTGFWPRLVLAFCRLENGCGVRAGPDFSMPTLAYTIAVELSRDKL
jgi:hypothetical protein